MILAHRQMGFTAVWKANKVSVIRCDTNQTYYTVPADFVTCLGLSPSGTVVAVATETPEGCYIISAYEPDRFLRCRVLIPFYVKSVAVNNTVSTVAFVSRTEDLPYDVIFLYNVEHDLLTTVPSVYGPEIHVLRFVTNNALMINTQVIVVDV
jgi:hypothetical protein